MEDRTAARHAGCPSEICSIKRPLAIGLPGKNLSGSALGGETLPDICKELNWSSAYTRGVLGVWKRQSAYCRAVLAYKDRIRLDGSPAGQPVTEEARIMAKARLAQIAAEKAARVARLQEKEKQQQQEPSQAAYPSSSVPKQRCYEAGPFDQPDT